MIQGDGLSSNTIVNCRYGMTFSHILGRKRTELLFPDKPIPRLAMQELSKGSFVDSRTLPRRSWPSGSVGTEDILTDRPRRLRRGSNKGRLRVGIDGSSS